MFRSVRAAVVVAAVALAAAGWATLPVGRASEAQARTTTPPSTATITIQPGGLFGGVYSPSSLTLARGGTLRVVNHDNMQHSVTARLGTQYFDTVVLPGHTATVSGVSRLPAGTYRFYCRFHSTMTGVLTIRGSGGTAPGGQQFLQPLKLPPVLTGANITLPIKQTAVRVLPNGNLTRMWTYGNSYPGPIIRRPAGQDTKITFVNKLPSQDGSFTVHLHGDHHKAIHDGQPTTQLIGPGQRRTYDFPLRDGGKPERASTFWYHDHLMHTTGRNVWRGLEGIFIVDDAKDRSLPLPKGKYDVPLMISDRSFTSTNQLTNPFATQQPAGSDQTVGKKVLVDGRYAPYLNVDTHRYRLRLINGSNFQSYNFKLSDGRPFVQIGTGNGLLPAPVKRSTILLGPAQRADVVVNFNGEKGKRVVLKSVARTDSPPPGSVVTNPVSIMQFRVNTSVADHTSVPASLQAPPPLTVPNTIAKTWTIGLDEAQNMWTINGLPFDDMRTDYEVPLGATQKWKIVNDSPITHYFHLHEEQWHTISRNGHAPPPWERGLEDTWKLDPGESVVVAAKFTDFTGRFMIHCHMLDHEDHGLMAQFAVVAPGSPLPPATFADVHRMAGAAHAAAPAAAPGRVIAAPDTAGVPAAAPSFRERFLIRFGALLLLAAGAWLVVATRRRPAAER